MPEPMPTDRERLTALLDEWGVGYNGPNAQVTAAFEQEGGIVLAEGDAKIGGYNNFFAVFEFHEDGSFKRVAVWE